MGHVYNDDFFDYIEAGARDSAKAIIARAMDALTPASVADFGCGRGVWLSEWQAAGVRDICGLDGDYVNRAQLAIAPEAFRPVDLTRPVDLGRRFDLVQSLEVGEHLPGAASATFVASLVAHGDVVLFSAAVPGQGGEDHINERPLRFWQELFASHGYLPFDCIRPGVKDNRAIEPWYRYNSILYANAAGMERLSQAARATALRPGDKVRETGDILWKARRAVVSLLPRSLVTWIAQTRARIIAARSRK